MMGHIQQGRRALDFVKHDAPAVITGRLDLALERFGIGKIFLVDRRLEQIEGKHAGVPESLAQERALAGQPGAEEEKAVALGQDD